MGRGYWPGAFSSWLAGGGVKGGLVHGATDEYGQTVVEKPVHVHDLPATILHLMGIDHTRLTYRHAGRISGSPTSTDKSSGKFSRSQRRI